MTISDWQLQNPISAVIFDCDGTLSTIEGIDTLAEQNGTGESVKALTAEAMGKSGLTPALYQQRLAMVKPTKAQVLELGQTYYEHRVPDSCAVINALLRLKKTIYIVSAGLKPAVTVFANQLQIPEANVFAVDTVYDDKGDYLDFDHHSPLIHNDGKRSIVKQLLLKHHDIIYVGDGMNDLAVYDHVVRFIGYGGIFYRENIANQSDVYIKTESLAPLLPLILTQNEFETSHPEDEALYLKGLQAISEGQGFFPTKSRYGVK